MRALLFLVLIALPSVAFAANTTFLGPIVPECARAGTSVCQACDLVKLADNLLKFMVAFSVFGAALMFAYAGFLYVTAATSKGNLDKARKVFSDVFIGLIIVLVAWIVVDLVLRTFTNQSLNVLTSIRCASYNPTSQRWDVGDLEQDQSVEPGSGTGGGAGTKPAPGTPGEAISRVDGTTTYNPGGGGDNGPDMDAYGGVPYTVQDCKNDIAAGKACQPITVAVPQDLRDKGLLKPKTVVTWDEAARKYGLPPGTRFILSDVYGCYWSNTRKRYDGVNACDIGRTKTGGFSFDVAGCSRVRNKVCTVPTNSYSNLPPPKPVPGG